MFTKYHLGIAYQAAIAAANRGTLDRQPELNRQNLDAGREASANFQDSFAPVPYTVGEARRANSFDYRTSVVGSSTVATTEIVHEKDPVTGELRAVQKEIPPEQRGRQSNAPSRMPRGDDEDEPLLEPPIFGTRPIVRPDW